MAEYKSKVIFGMKNIHVAKIEDNGNFATPVPILGAKNAEATFESSSKTIYADNKPVYNDKRITSGSGKLTVLGLTTDEKCLLAGAENMSGGIALSSDMNAPSLALLFEQDKADGGKILNVIYSTQFSIPAINAVTTEEEMEEQLTELDFSCLPVLFNDLGKSYFFYSVDTKDPNIDQDLVDNWYTQVQAPKITGTLSVQKIDNLKNDN